MRGETVRLSAVWTNNWASPENLQVPFIFCLLFFEGNLQNATQPFFVAFYEES